MQYIDLTQTFTDNMPVYPGDPQSSLKQTATIEKDTYTDHVIHSNMHVGTHMDAPLHMIKGGKTMDQIEPDRFFGKGIFINAKGKPSINEALLENIEIPESSIVLIYTGFGDKYRTPAYYEENPQMTENFAKHMVDKKVKIVGMDILGPDVDTNWPAHKILLGHEVLIIENLTNLAKLAKVGKFNVIALPAKYNAEAAPVRVLAETL